MRNTLECRSAGGGGGVVGCPDMLSLVGGKKHAIFVWGIIGMKLPTNLRWGFITVRGPAKD